MKRLLMAVVAVASVGLAASSVSAQSPYGFQAYGFYQPYGVRYQTRTHTPPYFALNPPVYYGARYSRPYGMSPFASPPVVSAPAGYQGRLRSQALDGPHHSVAPGYQSPVCDDCNPYVQTSASSVSGQAVAKVGKVRLNPFVNSGDRLVAN